MRTGSTQQPGAWQALRESLDGAVVLPEDAGYDAARRLFNGRFEHLRPAAVAYPEHAADIAECLAVARSSGVPVAVRSGGHSYAGWSGGTGRLVVDVGRMARVDVDGRTATVGAGARLGAVYDQLAAHGVTVPAGTCPTVGIAGLTLGGGHGVMSRAYGLTCDNLVRATLVTADGREIVCDDERDPELFWALRGAGGGTFGVVTGLELRTHPTGPTASADLAWAWRDARRVLADWQQWVPSLPDHVWTALRLQRTADGPTVSATVFSLGDRDELESLVDGLPGGAVDVVVREEPHADAMRRLGGEPAAERDAAAPDFAPDGEPGAEPEAHPHYYDVRSQFLRRPLPSGGVEAATRAVEAAGPGIEVVVAVVALGGATNRVAPGETAFVHRDSLFLVQHEAYWTPSDLRGPAEVAAAERAAGDWLVSVHDVLRPYASGEAYQNVPDPRLPDAERAYYGDAVPRLRRVRHRLDPDGVFSRPRTI
ncbi:FAD-binding protein [Promicromonospora sukumoe]|uniref:FAD-dependent oxidoreductase n=1 Tax=Promicromonospora sukumoe TaxID=88382 RepID=UPI00364972E9